MHTARQLFPSSFECAIDGQSADLDEVFPGWNASDRFGIVVEEPFGSLGASLLLQAAIAQFYDCRPQRRESMLLYPEIYLFHVGGVWGDHSFFDFWPPRKEVVLAEACPIELLAALNEAAITRLAIPDGVGGDPELLESGPNTWSEQQSLRDRLLSCFAYASTGIAEHADVAIATLDSRAEENAVNTLDARRALARICEAYPDGLPPDTGRWVARAQARLDEVSSGVRSDLRRRRIEAASGSTVVRMEAYRRLTVDEALVRIAGLTGLSAN